MKGRSRASRTRIERDVFAVTGIALLGAAWMTVLVIGFCLVVFGKFSAAPVLRGAGVAHVREEGAAAGGPLPWRRLADWGAWHETGHFPTWSQIEDRLTGQDAGDSAVLLALLARRWHDERATAAEALGCTGPALLRALDGAHYGWSDCIDTGPMSSSSLPGSPPLAAVRDVATVVSAAPALERLQRGIGGDVALVNLHGGVVERAAAAMGTQEAQPGDDAVPSVSAMRGIRGAPLSIAMRPGWPADAQWPVMHRDRAEVRRVTVDGRHYWQTALPVTGADDRQIGWLVWRTGGAALASADVAPIDTGAIVDDDPISRVDRYRSSAFGMVFFIAVVLVTIGFGVGLRGSFAVIFAPLRRAMTGLRRVADGRSDVHLDDVDRDRDDEAGVIVRAATALHAELAALQTLRDERARAVAQQGQLMRAQLRTLAATLDEGDRAAILRTLDALQAPSDSLIDLAAVLTQMTRLVCEQHQRLRGLLAEREAALVQEVRFAALRQELLIAQQMQMSILPQGLPAACGRAGLALAPAIQPAREVGGDFYDYFMLDDRHLAIVIADVSGKGVPAAFFMAVARSLLKNIAGLTPEPAAVMTRLNALLCEDNPHCMFVTLFFGVLDLETRTFDYANAGHNFPVWLNRAVPDEARWLDQGRGMALGASSEACYTQHREILDRRDIVFFYTDGVTEACDHAEALYGDNALRDTVIAAVGVARLVDASVLDNVAATGGAPPSSAMRVAAHVTDAVLRSVHAFADGVPQADDITCVALAWNDEEAR
ncbi:serine phosphatase RsbU (regulator of sigma subunit) [Robbsia andropogonis]|uniref:SpoIIE family protein phosphatase n=1 Tax=Robbsia andropogonis TaxID=28092 RepID=UPI003D1AA448